MTRSMRRMRTERAAQRPTSSAYGEGSPVAEAQAASYDELRARLTSLRVALVSDSTSLRPIADVRRDHDDLVHSLSDAIASAFAADALGVAPPHGVTWAGEGLARSHERELAIFAASDACGVGQPTAMPTSPWGASA
jgi:hypothetical protein